MLDRKVYCSLITKVGGKEVLCISSVFPPFPNDASCKLTFSRQATEGLVKYRCFMLPDVSPTDSQTQELLDEIRLLHDGRMTIALLGYAWEQPQVIPPKKLWQQVEQAWANHELNTRFISLLPHDLRKSFFEGAYSLSEIKVLLATRVSDTSAREGV